ncbi:MAG: hypothetical protein N0A24_07630 [Armatimonadetes bacterium]|nr:hypothetical protein [Armatimonadota bacterium]MDW8154069.1 hypothetical protein [Armatimonadota bacterium]
MRRWLFFGLGLGVVAGAIFISAVEVSAAIVARGIPVVSLGSSTPAVPNCPTLEGSVCYDPSTGRIGFYIPLNPAYNGIYGVTPVPSSFPHFTAGTIPDARSGSFSNPDALRMFLLFSPVGIPVGSATLTFRFEDLDLTGANDPSRFFERIAFYDASGSPLSGPIHLMGSGCTPLPCTITGDANQQTITFSDSPQLRALLTGDPFFVELRFGSHADGKKKEVFVNTPEFLWATLQTERLPPPQVPEPPGVLLWGTALVMTAWGRRRGML